jgi:predicted oxidoreductase
MKTYRLPHTELDVSRLGYGCMGLAGAESAQAAAVVAAALEAGVNFFDHADIYGRGRSEAVFGEALRQMPGARDRIVLQSKGGIRFDGDPRPGDPGRYDFSYEHITRAVEGSLRRLQTDRLDVLLLHRPDPLAEPEEVARAFDDLERSGKVRHFGVSNHTPEQIELLKTCVTQPLVVNQLELSLLHNHLIDDGVMANQNGGPYARSAGTLDYCRRQGLLVQAWGAVANGRVIDPPRGADARTRGAAEAVARMAREKGVSKEAIALAWLLRHPARIQPLIGTTRLERLRASLEADAVALTREEWYRLYAAGRGAGVP